MVSAGPFPTKWFLSFSRVMLNGAITSGGVESVVRSNVEYVFVAKIEQSAGNLQ
jgi:hypothetical protein